MSPTNSHPLPYNVFEELAASENENLVSVYIPMDLKGHEQNQHLAQNRLKNCLKDARQQLDSNGMNASEAGNLLQPAEALLDDVDLWRNPSEGLVIFLSPDNEMRYYRIPVEFEIRVYVGKRYFLSPLLPLYHKDGCYYLLELSQDYVKLYKASRFEFTDMDLKEVAPQQLEEAVGFDHEQKSLQWHTGQRGKGANFHGHGAGKDDERKEVITFLRKVNEGVIKKIEGQQSPLVLSCVDDLVPLYKKVNSYNTLFPGHVSGDPEFKTEPQRHQESWEVVRQYFEQQEKDKVSSYDELKHTDKGTSNPKVIIPAAINGRVDTLFIARGTSITGTFDREQNSINVEGEKNADNTSLSDLAAIKTFMQGGKVYFMSPEDMPEADTSMNAVLRF